MCLQCVGIINHAQPDCIICSSPRDMWRDFLMACNFPFLLLTLLTRRTSQKLGRAYTHMSFKQEELFERIDFKSKESVGQLKIAILTCTQTSHTQTTWCTYRKRMSERKENMSNMSISLTLSVNHRLIVWTEENWIDDFLSNNLHVRFVNQRPKRKLLLWF